MVIPARLFAPAAAMVVAALFVMATGCGGDSDGTRASPAPSTGEGQAPGGATIADVDLATDDGLRVFGIDPEDLLTGTASLASGDFNDDGEADLLIGAPQGDGPENDRTEAGEAYIIFGPLDQGRDLARNQGDVVIYGASAGDGLSYSVLAADINDDGVQDVLVGAPGVTAGFDPRTDQGRVYAFYGGSDFGDESVLDLADDIFDLTITGAEGFSRLGHSMAAGDVDGDDSGDLVVGAPFAGRPPDSAPGSERTALGEAYVILGSSDLGGEKNMARGEYDALISGAHAFGEFASSLAVADVNGDGRDDIVAGAHRSSAGMPARESSGAAYVFSGREDFDERISAQDGDQDVLILGSPGATLGYPISAGDFDGDGIADIAVGAQLEATGEIQASGAVHVFFGGDRIPAKIDLAEEAADVRISGRETSEFLPSSLTSVDLDADGRSELVAGSMLVAASADRFGSGVVYVISLDNAERTIDLSAEETVSVLGAKGGDRLGNALGPAVLSKDVRAIAALASLADGGDRSDNGIVYLLGFQP